MFHQCKNGDCKHITSPCSQTLDELEFERGIWQPALDGNLDRIKVLLSNGIDVNMRDHSGYSALHYAARNSHFNVVDYLLKNGACANITTRSGKDSPLHRAAFVGSLDVIDILIKNGGDIHAQNVDGQTCLHRAVIGQQNKMISFLLQVDLSLANVKDYKGKVALDYKN